MQRMCISVQDPLSSNTNIQCMQINFAHVNKFESAYCVSWKRRTVDYINLLEILC